MIPYWALLTLASALFFALRDVYRKKVLFKASELEFFVAAGLLELFFVPLFLPKLELGGLAAPETLLLLVARSAIATASAFFIVQAYKNLDASKVAPMQPLSPLLLLFLAIIFLGEQPQAKHVLGICLVIAGAYLLEYRERRWKSRLDPLKEVWRNPWSRKVLYSLVLWSFLAIIDKTLLKQINSETFYVLTTAINVSVFVGYWLARGKDPLKTAKDVAAAAGAPLFLAVFFNAAQNLAVFAALALPETMVSVLIPLRRLSAVFTVLLSGKILKEENIASRAAAAVVMVIGSYFLVF